MSSKRDRRHPSRRGLRPLLRMRSEHRRGTMAKSHKDKVAVITGAANGIGQAFAKRLAEDGVHIVVADVAPGRETVKMVEQIGREAFAFRGDVSSEESVKALASDVVGRFGCCDILINCAGIYPNQPFDRMTFSD